MITAGNWRASAYAIESLNAYHLRENAVAERRQGTNVSSAIGFLSLGLFGASVLLIPGAVRSRSWSGLMFLLLLYWGWCGLTVLWSPDVFFAAKKTFILMLLVAGMFGISGFLHLGEFIWATILSTTAFIVTGLIAELSLGTFHPGAAEYRFCGLFHTNSQSFFGAVLCIASLCLRFDDRKWRFLALAFFSVGVACIVLTKSRSAMAGLLVCSVLVSVFIFRGWWRVAQIGVMGSLASFLALLLATLSPSLSRGFLGVAAMGRTEHTASLTGRVPLWKELLNVVSERPFLGHGFGSFWNSERVTYYSEMFSWEIPSGHSVYIDVVLELGLVGGALFFSCLVFGLAIGVWRYEHHRDARQLFPVAIIVFAFVHGFTESQFAQTGFGGLILAGCLLFLARRPEIVHQATKEQYELSSQPP